MTSLVFLAAVIWVVIAAKQTLQKTISQISRGWDGILRTLALECGPSSFYNSIASCLSVLFSCAHPLRSRGITAKERLFVWL